MNPDIRKTQKPCLAEPTAIKRRSNLVFRPRRVPLAPDAARRQGNISQLAFLLLGGRDPAVAFLNAENSELGGRPLAVATASAEGYAQVAAAVRARGIEALT
ncbi:hypothetical protein [Sphingopyxis panaciterrae]